MLIEAMAHGKPVVATRVGPIPSIVDGAGITVPYGDVAGIRRAVKKILKNPEKYKKNAIKIAKNYNVKRVVDKLEKIYREL